MSMINPLTGARVDDADAHIHKDLWMTLDSDQELQLARAAFPTLGWHAAHGTTVFSYKKRVS